MIDQVCISFKLSAVDHLVLIAEIHIEPGGKGPVDPDKEPILVDPGAGSFAVVM